MLTNLVSQYRIQKELKLHPEKIQEIFVQFHHSSHDLSDGFIDSLLGLTADTVEKDINRQNLDHTFGVEQFVYEGTPYNFTRWFLHVLDPTEKDIVYDLGCGYGRVPLYGALTTPAFYRGVEIVPERINLANDIKRKFAITNVEFTQANVLNYDFTDGTMFFLFNPFTDATFRKVLSQLEHIARTRWIRIIAWGGGRTELLRHQPWLHDLTREMEQPQPFRDKISVYESITD